ncbi:MAG: hypothetical protein HZY76_02090 [Anaerolineae bacterium]|nr:MAG: hypothetical protein HZY76_02090 [Anaerolineae bacterium]
MEGKTVIGIGVADTTSNYLGRAVDQFVFYQELVGRPLPSRNNPGPKRRPAHCRLKKRLRSKTMG